jgi:hypothetical protein
MGGLVSKLDEFIDGVLCSARLTIPALFAGLKRRPKQT